MSGALKSLSKLELKVYSNTIFPVRRFGFLKFWVKPKDYNEDIRHGRIVGVAFVKKFKVVKIKVPTVGYKGGYLLSPDVVLSQLDRKDFARIGGYSVKINTPIWDRSKNFSNGHQYYDATATLYVCETKPKSLLNVKTNIVQEVLNAKHK